MPTSHARAPIGASRVGPGTSWGGWARTFGGTFGANIKSQLRFYTFGGWMVASLLTPLFLLATSWVIASFLSGGGGSAVVPAYFLSLTGYPDYLAFVLLGLGLNGLVLSALDDGGAAVYEEETQGTWDLIALTPMNRFVWMLSKTGAGMVASLVEVAIVLGVGFVVLDLDIHVGGIGTATFATMLTMLGLLGFAFLMAAAGLFWKQPYALSIILSPAIIFGSGMLFPVQALPDWVQTLASGFPLTHGLHIVREALLLGVPMSQLGASFAWLLVTGAAFMIVGFTAFHRMETRARRAGVLGRY